MPSGAEWCPLNSLIRSLVKNTKIHDLQSPANAQTDHICNK